MNIAVEQLVGKRVELRSMQAEHVNGLFEAARYPEIWTHLASPIRPIKELGEMARLVKDAIASRRTGHEWPFVVIDRTNGQIIGSTRYVEITPAHRAVEIGWTWLTPSVWRTAVNTECKYLLLRHAFETVGVIRVQFKTDSRNTRSQAAIERIGGVKEGILRSHRILSDGYIRDSVYYSIVEDEWPSVKARLEQMLHDAPA